MIIFLSFFDKLKTLKSPKFWNKEVFGKKKNISICEDQIKHLHFQLDKDGPQDNINLLLDQSRKQYENLLRQEEIF